jgi:hypothetical protein
MTNQQLHSILSQLEGGTVAFYCPGVSPLGWTLKIEDGEYTINYRLNTAYRMALRQRADALIAAHFAEIVAA